MCRRFNLVTRWLKMSHSTICGEVKSRPSGLWVGGVGFGTRSLGWVSPHWTLPSPLGPPSVSGRGFSLVSGWFRVRDHRRLIGLSSHSPFGSRRTPNPKRDQAPHVLAAVEPARHQKVSPLQRCGCEVLQNNPQNLCGSGFGVLSRGSKNLSVKHRVD